MNIINEENNLFEGKGTKEEPYKIKEEKDLNNLSHSVNSGTDYKGKYFSVTKQIEWRMGFKPIGGDTSDEKDTGTAFNGVFDGNGNYISIAYAYTSKYYLGMFGHIGTEGIVKNLLLHATQISGSGIGTIAGICEGTIKNCMTNSRLCGETYGRPVIGYDVGGVVGVLIGNTARIYNSFCSLSYINAYNKRIGGIAGSAKGGAKIENCYCISMVLISGEKEDVGGIVGLCDSNSSLSNCYWRTVTTTSKAIGSGEGLMYNCTSKTDEEMGKAQFSYELNQNTKDDWKKWTFRSYYRYPDFADSQFGEVRKVNIQADSKQCKLSVSDEYVIENTEVKITCVPEAGYILKEIVVTYNNVKKSVENNVFVMPESDVIVSANLVPAVVEISNNGKDTYYETIFDAVEDIENMKGDIILKLLSDVLELSKTITVSKNITFDFSKYIIKSNSNVNVAFKVLKHKSLVICCSNDTKTHNLILEAKNSIGIDNSGSVRIINGILSADSCGVYNNSDSMLFLEGGTINSTAGYGIKMLSGSQLKISGGSVYGSKIGISIDEGSDTVIDGGEVVGSNDNSYGISNLGKLKILSGSIHGKKRAIYGEFSTKEEKNKISEEKDIIINK